MWVPTLLKALNESDLYSMGLQIPVEAIYDENNASIKDAIVLFGGGCTAEVISSRGLLLTNHHCGYSQIQSHSSLQNDYLKDGFWAMSRAEELPNPGLTATFIVRMADVTSRVEAELALRGMAAYREITAAIIAEELEGSKDEAVIKPFNYGNSYFIIVSRTFRDVRLVGAPPSAIGKFGGDTDNWVWPRHTGDFSLFRIYAGPDNQPADYNPVNQPLVPSYHLPVSLKGVEENDFCMVYGFPGRTEQYLTSNAVEFVMNELNPVRIGMRDASLEIVNAAMLSSDLLRIKYASKQSGIANAWKKWIGQNQGLLETGALNKKLELEKEFRLRAEKSEKENYIAALDSSMALNEMLEPYYQARSAYIELMFYGPELLSLSAEFSRLVNEFDSLNEEERSALAKELTQSARAFYKDYDLGVDRQLAVAMFPLYSRAVDNRLESSLSLKYGTGSSESGLEELYATSVFADSTRLFPLLAKFGKKQAAKLKKDFVFQMAESINESYAQKVKDPYSSINGRVDAFMKTYVKGLQELFPERVLGYDANSTLRLTYGKVEGSAPWDGMEYTYYTTARGILQKYKPGHPDFDLPEKLIKLLKERKYGPYAHGDGELRVCFTGSNHTTGGNSGSPALNAKGELVGLNFDRSWESTMSDILFDPGRCRNIMVDIRYVLWVIDIYAGAGHLIKEMTITRGSGEEPEMGMNAIPYRN